MKTVQATKLSGVLAWVLLVLAPCVAIGAPSAPGQNASWQRITAHINGVFSPRGFFNLLVGLYSLPSLRSAQFNLGRSSIVMDFPPNTPEITPEQIHRIEKSAGYRPGTVEVEHIAARNFAEKGPGWIRIKHPQSRNALRRWLEQNF